MSDAPLSARPWRQISPAMLAPVAGVPTMLSAEEQQLYYWLARSRAGGPGPIADLGSFVGGSAARMALGLADGGLRGPVHMFDRFTVQPGVKQRILYAQGIPPFDGEDLLPLSQRLLAPWADRLRWHRGDILGKSWPANAHPIRLMTLDICKLPSVADHVTLTFLPHLREGAIVVQQDFLQWDQPWTPVQMLLLGDWLEPLVRVGSSLVFHCVRVPDREALAQATITDLDDAALIAGLDEAARAYAAFDVAEGLALAAEVVRRNPGIRKPWELKKPAA